MSQTRVELLQHIRQHSVQRGTFTLASGQTSNVYIDIRKTSLDGKGGLLIGRTFLEVLQGLKTSARGVGGLTLGADPLVTATCVVAELSGLIFGGVLVRKESKGHGTGSKMEVASGLVPGDRIVAVDDVITSGGSTLKAVQAMRDFGFIVEDALCVVDRGAGEALSSEGVTLHSVFTLQEILEE